MFGRFLDDEGGATAIEYALVASLIALAIVVGVGSLATSTGNAYNSFAEKFPDP